MHAQQYVKIKMEQKTEKSRTLLPHVEKDTILEHLKDLAKWYLSLYSLTNNVIKFWISNWINQL